MVRIGLIAIFAASLLAASGQAQDFEDFKVDSDLNSTPPVVATSLPAGTVPCAVKFIAEPVIAAREAGVLLLAPKEGQFVEVDQLIAQTDDEEARLTAQVAAYAVEALKKEVSSDIRERYSKASEDVSRLDYEKSRRANEITPGAIPHIELMQKKFRWTEAQLGFENTRHERAITEINLSEKKAEYERAMAMVDRHKVLSPIRGMVAEVMERKGEYVRPGDPVAQIVKLDRVKITAKLKPDEFPMHTMMGRNVRITIDLAEGLSETLDGVITFVNPRVDASRTYEVWAEVDVPNENIFDEMHGQMQFVN